MLRASQRDEGRVISFVRLGLNHDGSGLDQGTTEPGFELWSITPAFGPTSRATECDAGDRQVGQSHGAARLGPATTPQVGKPAGNDDPKHSLSALCLALLPTLPHDNTQATARPLEAWTPLRTQTKSLCSPRRPRPHLGLPFPLYPRPLRNLHCCLYLNHTIRPHVVVSTQGRPRPSLKNSRGSSETSTWILKRVIRDHMSLTNEIPRPTQSKVQSRQGSRVIVLDVMSR